MECQRCSTKEVKEVKEFGVSRNCDAVLRHGFRGTHQADKMGDPAGIVLVR